MISGAWDILEDRGTGSSVTDVTWEISREFMGRSAYTTGRPLLGDPKNTGHEG